MFDDSQHQYNCNKFSVTYTPAGVFPFRPGASRPAA